MKRKLTNLIAALLVTGVSCFAADYYVAPGGSDSNAGTLSNPFQSLGKAIDVASAGDYIYLRGGTYSMSTSPFVISKSGNSGAPIRIFAYNGESPILQFNNVVSSSNRGVVLDGDFWHWKGITIERAGDNGMLLSGSNNTIEDCVFRRNNDTGLQLSRYNTDDDQLSEWPSYNTIVGCEAYDNSDPDHEDADGFAAKLTSGVGNVFRSCISHHNIDDGWDLYTKSETGPIGKVIFEDCIAHNNGTLTDGSTSGGGDKNGFKLGSSAHNIDHELRRCIAFNNGKHGFTDNGNVGNIKFYNLTSYNNGDYNFHVRDGASHTFRNCVTYQGNHTDRIVGDAPVSCNALDETDIDWVYVTSSSDFQTLTPGPNAAPTSNGFLSLSSSSSFIDAGCSVSGVSYNGSAPDLGAVEYGGTLPPPPPPGTTYSLTTNVSGSGSVSGGGTYDENTTATITANPSSGWVFSNWTGDASGTNQTTTVYMNGNKNVTAVFTEDGSTDPPPSGDGDVIHNFTESGMNSSFFNISGNLSDTKGTVVYNGLTLTQCLKIESSTSITFSTSQDATLTLVFNENWSGGFVVDGTSRNVSGGILTVDLAAGSHSLSKDDVANLYYISLVYEGTTPPPPPSGNITVRARGVQGGEQIELVAGGSTIATWTLSTSYQDYSASGSGNVQVWFVNDNSGYDVQVDYVIVDGVTMQAEDQATNTGVWSGTCGGSNSEWLHCSGYIEFGGSVPPPASYTLSTSVNGQGSISGGGTYDEGTTVTLTATAASGWELSSWSGVDASNGNTATVTMNSNRNVSAIFTETSTPPPSGNITIRARGTQGGEQIQLVVGGETVATWTLTTSYTDYSSTGSGNVQVWFVNDNGSYDVQVDHAIINGVTLQSEDQATNTGVWSGTCGGSYSEWLHCNGYIEYGGSTPPPPTYSLSASVNGQGSVSGAGTYDEGTVVSITANPASGWQFENWSGAATGTNATTTVTMNSNLSVTANFSEIPQGGTELTLQESAAGFCSVDGAIETEHSGYTGSGYANTENATGAGIDYAVNVTSNGIYDVEVRYAATSDRPANLMQNGSVVGSFSLPQSGAWDNYVTQSASVYLTAGGSSLRLEATGGSGLPNIDYLKLSGPGVATDDCDGGTNPPQTFTLSVSVSGGGTVTPNGGTFNAGKVVSLTAIAGTDYVFSNWTGDASGSSSTTTVTMDSDKSVTAIFNYDGGNGGSDVNFALVGWATEAGGTTGGQGGPVVTVSSGQELQDAIDMGGPRIIYVNGTITDAPDGKINVKDVSDISILGAGSGAEFNGIGIKIWRASNIIIRNLRIHHVTQGDKDCISIEGPSDHIWIDHCELYAEYQGVDKDYYDGLLDAKGDAEYITYSWNYLHDSWKTSLVGSSESDDYDRKITMHHNMYENCNSRLPLFRGGNGHIFNCYYKDNVSTTINTRIGACLRVENNYFENSKNPWVSAYSDVLGGVDESGNILVNSPFDYSNSDVNEALSCNAWVPYTYSHVLNNTSEVPAIVQQYAGVGKLSDPESFTEVKTADESVTSLGTVGIDNLEVFPNPFSEYTTISFELSNDQEVSFSIVDMTGRTVDVIEPVSYSAGQNHVTYKNGSLKAGLYMLSVQYGGTVENIRLVLE